MQKKSRRFLALLLSVVLVVSMLPGVSAASLSDIKGHWAEDYIEYGVSSGYISGYTDGTFRPNKTVTRAEFSKMVNTALGINHTVSIAFTDVAYTAWYYDVVRKAVSAGYISGYADNTFGADRNVTRQETAVMLARIVTEPESATATAFKDAASIDSWALSSITKMAAKSYMLGDSNNNFRPKAALTRAEAAKILYEVLKNEIIASNNQSFSVAGSSYYNTIYPNNVTVTEGVTNGAINFNSCRILGTLTMNGGMESAVNLSNTGVNTLAAASASGEAKIALSGSSYVTKTVVNNGVTLSGSGFNTVDLSGNNLSSDTVRLIGDFNTVNVSTDAVVKASGGTISQFTVLDKATLMLQAATITRMDIESAAKNSMLSLADGVSIGTAYIKTSASFTGAGTITTAYEGSGTVSYETRPISVVGGSASDDDEDDDNDNYDDNYGSDASSLVPSFYPSTQSTNISTDPSIRLYFDAPIYRSKYKTEMTTSYIENYAVELREGSLSGYSVPFTASLNSSKTTISISPDEYLEENTRYYVVVLSDTIYNASGESNGRSYAYFTTESGDSSDNNNEYTNGTLIPTVYPANNSTNVSKTISVRLSFGETIYRASGSTLSSAYLESSCIEIHKDTVDGPTVSFNASLNSSKNVFTLTPGAWWEANTTYYIVIPARTLSDKKDNLNSRFVARFSTGSTIDGGDITFTPANNAQDVAVDSQITISFDSPIYRYDNGGTVNKVYLEESVLSLRKGSSYGTPVTFTAEISSNKRNITIIPDTALDANTTYYVSINNYTLKYASGTNLSATTTQFRTTDGVLRVSDLSVGEVTSSTADVHVTSNTTGTVTVTLTPSSGGTPQTQTVSTTAGVRTTLQFVSLDSDSEYTVTAVAKDASGKTSDRKTITLETGSLSFNLEATNITKNSATVKVSYNSVGTVSVTYKKEGDTQSKVLLSPFTPNNAGSTSRSLYNLEEGATYLISATFEDASGNITTRDTAFKTEAKSTDATLKSLFINSTEGSFEVPLVSGIYTYDLAIGNTSSITVVATATSSTSSLYINNQLISGSYTMNVSNTSNTEKLTQIKISVRPESGTSQTYTVNVMVAPRTQQ